MEDAHNTFDYSELDLTQRVPSTRALMEMFNPDTGFLTPTNEKGLLFFFAERSLPIFVRDRKTTSLGRSSGNYKPSLDLTDLDGKASGVSRHHADILREGKTYYLRDADSTNGTWVNNNRIRPQREVELRDGDHVRLGQLTMIVRFISGNTMPRNGDAVVLSVED